MQPHPTWNTRLGVQSPDDVFQYLMLTLTPSIKTFGYFVDWATAQRRFREVEPEVNLLNVLLGKEDLRQELDSLLQKYPQVVKAFPLLFAYRLEEDGGVLPILTDYAGGKFQYKEYCLQPKALYSPQERSELVEFADKMGLLDLFRSRVTRSLPDYAFGAEVGLNSNARKNRGGTLMEDVVFQILSPICIRHGWKMMKQPAKKKLAEEWDLQLAIDQTDVRPDLAVSTPHGLWLIETNFYNSQGSKLKATAGEYRGKSTWCKNQGHHYLWISDGTGWNQSRAALRECFDAIDYTLNLKMATAGCLEDILADP